MAAWMDPDSPAAAVAGAGDEHGLPDGVPLVAGEALHASPLTAWHGGFMFYMLYVSS